MAEHRHSGNRVKRVDFEYCNHPWCVRQRERMARGCDKGCQCDVCRASRGLKPKEHRDG